MKRTEQLPASDGSAGDVNYGLIGSVYSRFRCPDPRIQAAISEALGDAETVLNIGAGAGSYEPLDRQVTAVEPSASMRAQRPPQLPEAIDAVAEDLPFPDRHFDAAMGTFTIHQWRDLASGLKELRRVTRGPVVLLTCDPSLLYSFWLNDYCPEVLAVEGSRYPKPADVARHLGGTTSTRIVPIPLDCTDGFNEAYYGRPEMLLDPAARKACSAWWFVDEATMRRFEKTLAGDLASGSWDARYRHLRSQPSYEGSLILIVSQAHTPAGADPRSLASDG